MGCRTTAAYKFRARLVSKQYDVTLIKELSVLTKMKQCVRLRCCLTFIDYELAIEIDEHGHNDKNIGYEIKKKTKSNTKISWQ